LATAAPAALRYPTGRAIGEVLGREASSIWAALAAHPGSLPARYKRGPRERDAECEVS